MAVTILIFLPSCSCISAAPGPMAFSFIALSPQWSEAFNCLHATSLAASLFSFDVYFALGIKTPPKQS